MLPWSRAATAHDVPGALRVADGRAPSKASPPMQHPLPPVGPMNEWGFVPHAAGSHTPARLLPSGGRLAASGRLVERRADQKLADSVASAPHDVPVAKAGLNAGYLSQYTREHSHVRGQWCHSGVQRKPCAPGPIRRRRRARAARELKTYRTPCGLCITNSNVPPPGRHAHRRLALATLDRPADAGTRVFVVCAESACGLLGTRCLLLALPLLAASAGKPRRLDHHELAAREPLRLARVAADRFSRPLLEADVGRRARRRRRRGSAPPARVAGATARLARAARPRAVDALPAIGDAAAEQVLGDFSAARRVARRGRNGPAEAGEVIRGGGGDCVPWCPTRAPRHCSRSPDRAVVVLEECERTQHNHAPARALSAALSGGVVGELT